MIQLTITMQDDGQITVEGPEMEQPYTCDSIAECAQFVEKVMQEESGESPEEQATEPKESYQEAWNQEAASRKPQTGLMA